MHVLLNHSDPDSFCRGAVIALGNFDGVHLGHHAVIGEALRLARAEGRPSGVVTFDPHPRRLFQPDAPPFVLSSLQARIRLIGALGLDWLLVERFDTAFASQTAESFVRDVLHETLGVVRVVVGEGFVFGKNRTGSSETLREVGATVGLDVVTVPLKGNDAGIMYSSSGVRMALERQDPRAAALILGRPWEIEGTVEQGDARARTIGFPTANIRLGEYQRPAVGVYAVMAGTEQGEEGLWIPGVANFGRRPTFDKTDEILEVHLFDTNADLYGKRMRVRFIDFIRPERKFPGLAALAEQIRLDAAQARIILQKEQGRLHSGFYWDGRTTKIVANETVGLR